jgi:signal transduction histidine kinase
MTIADTGVGIPASDLPLVFERFRRGSNVLDRFAGTGLSGVRRIVVQHGGDVTIASTEGVGTTATVALPMGEPPAEASETDV